MNAYFVLNENTLGLVKEARPQWFDVLAGKPQLYGHSHLNGPVHLTSLDTLRPATVEDFDSYRVSPQGHIV